MKDTAGSKLIEAMHTVLDGGVALSPEASTQIFEALTNNPGQRSKLHNLTDREFEIFELIGKGMDVHEIGDQLEISPRTVDAHRTHIREKLNLPNSQELLLYAVRWTETGEFSDPEPGKKSD
jgi:DNA-binding NarL/FixJ family response regulator